MHAAKAPPHALSSALRYGPVGCSSPRTPDGRTPRELPRNCAASRWQFTVGVVGGTYYWLVDLTEVRLTPSWPYIAIGERCAGGDARTVLVGYVTNAMLLMLFLRFYRRAYRARPSRTRSKDA